MSHRGSERRSLNDYIVDAIIMSYVESQEATTTAATVDRDESVKSCYNNKPFSLMWMNHIDDREGAIRQR
jgi:hypothetical protein